MWASLLSPMEVFWAREEVGCCWNPVHSNLAFSRWLSFSVGLVGWWRNPYVFLPETLGLAFVLVKKPYYWRGCRNLISFAGQHCLRVRLVVPFLLSDNSGEQRKRSRVKEQWAGEGGKCTWRDCLELCEVTYLYTDSPAPVSSGIVYV